MEIKKHNLILLSLLKKLRQKKKERTNIFHETHYFIDDIFLELEELTF